MSKQIKTDLVSYAFTIFIACGGIFAFIKTGSLQSLLAASAFSSLLAVGSYKTTVNRHDCHFSISVCVCLALIMGYRYVITSKFMFSGLVSSLSISMIVYLYGRLSLTHNKDKHD